MRQNAQSLVEYALVLVLIVIVVMILLAPPGIFVRHSLSTVSSGIEVEP